MKKLFDKSKNVIKKTKTFCIGSGAAMTALIASAVPVAAKPTTINDDATTESVVGGILDVIFQICLYLGIVIAVIGVVSFLMSFKDDNAEQQSRGVRLALVGAALMGIKGLIELTGLIG